MYTAKLFMLVVAVSERASVIAVVIAAAACGSGRAHQPTQAQSGGGRVVVISVDGLMPASYLDPEALGLRIPTLRRFVAEGAFARAVTPVFPTVTYPAHTTMVTGVPPAAHGIVGNRPKDPLERNQGGWWWYAEDIAAPTVWQAVHAKGGTAALITWPVTVGADVRFLVPEYWRAGTADDQKLLRSLSTRGLLDKVAAREPGLWKHLAPPDVADDAQFAIARHVLAEESPDLVLMHVWMVDDAQHRHGPGSREAIAAIEHADQLIGALVAQLEAGPGWARTSVIVVSDHGFLPVENQIRLNVAFAARGLVTLGADGKPTATRVTLLASGGTAFLYLDDPTARAEVDAAIASIGAPIARVYTRDEVVAAGGDPAVDLVLAAAPGYQFSDKRDGTALVPSTGKGDHGYPPTDPAMAASFLALGPRIPATDLGTIDMTDIAPTIAWLLDVPLPTATGHTIPALAR
jgi:predicted AlkP superfamily pyrophosphatase or phosphodiesterase